MNGFVWFRLAKSGNLIWVRPERVAAVVDGDEGTDLSVIWLSSVYTEDGEGPSFTVKGNAAAVVATLENRT